MDELKRIKSEVRPHEILLVVDAMTGQDAVNVASTFNETLGIDGLILTKLDGDTRGGAALSARAVTGKPIKFVGVGEKLGDLDTFHPDRMASRILGMGDVLSLIEKAETAIDEKKAAELEEKIRKNKFDLNDLLDQITQLRKMGSIQDTLAMLPGMGKKLQGVDVDEKQFDRLQALIRSMTPKERENAFVKETGTTFLMKIGAPLKSGKPHDGRAPDYDDYTSKGLNDLPGLNGDLLLWDHILQRSIELSSMGIRVDKEALLRQLKEEGEEERLELYFHKRLMNDTLPLSIGGGIGQSRLCMFYLRKAHIGEIQASIWPEDMRKECKEHNIHLI